MVMWVSPECMQAPSPCPPGFSKSCPSLMSEICKVTIITNHVPGDPPHRRLRVRSLHLQTKAKVSQSATGLGRESAPGLREGSRTLPGKGKTSRKDLGTQ